MASNFRFFYLKLLVLSLSLQLAACGGENVDPIASEAPASGPVQCTSHESIINFSGLESLKSVTNTTMQLNWTNHADAKGYVIFNVTNGANIYLKFIDAPTTSTTVTGLSANTDYSFIVKSVDQEFKMDANTQIQSATTTSAPPDQLLDTIANSSAVYSFRKLSNSYLGAAISVRRDSDDSVVDIGFDGYDLDVTALNTHLGGANGFVDTWYDQSGSGQNLSQSNFTYQPQIILSATPGGRAALRFDGVDDYLINSSLNYTARTGFFVFEMITGAQATTDLAQLWGDYAGGVQASLDPRSPTTMSFDGAGSTTADYALDGGSYSGSFEENPTATGWSMDTTHVLAVEFDADKVMSRHTVGSLFPDFTVGTHQFGGDISEIIIFSDAKSGSDKSAIESSQSGYY